LPAGILAEREPKNTLPILDPERVASLRVLEKKTAPGLLRDLVETFSVESGQALHNLETCSASGDLVGIRKSAHLLASMSAGVGASQFWSLAQAVEKWAVNPLDQASAPDISHLRRERDLAVSALQAVLGGDR